MDEEAILHELGKRIRTQRKRIGLSQEQLALVAGVDRSYYGAVERGERNITFLVLYRLCLALKCDVALLTTGLPPAISRRA
ncbi:helix-turn-helix domain-containing protein [Sphingobium cloacae]|uniref:helix-turn-helix domain-containing protein n=1 Tax=Sphingobium cloacae TaxID=120107 RepID=UPI00082B4886|nr:helix-turn-helix transcriptional regulator [Sphingobium cloacae]